MISMFPWHFFGRSPIATPAFQVIAPMTALGGAMNGLQPSHGHLTNKDGGMKPTMMGVEQDITEIVYGDIFLGI